MHHDQNKLVFLVFSTRYNPIPVCLIERDLSPSERGPILSRQGLIGTAIGLLFRFQSLGSLFQVFTNL